MFQRAFLMVVSTIFVLGLLVPVTAAHAENKAPTIAIVDVEKILADAKAAQSLQKQIQAKKESFQKEFSAKEKELETTKTSLLAEQSKLSAEDFGKKRASYEKSIADTRALFQKRRNSLDEGLNSAMQELRKSIVESAAKVADGKGYDIVVTRESVLIADKSLDITADVLKELDAKTTDIKLKVE